METNRVAAAITMKPPRLSLKKRTCPLTGTTRSTSTRTISKQMSKKAVPCSLSKASRPITPDLFFPILSTSDQPIDSPTKEERNLTEANFRPLESNQDVPTNLVAYKKEYNGDFSSRTTTKKKKLTTKLSSMDLSPSNTTFVSSLPNPKIKPKKRRITQSIVMLDADRKCYKFFQTANTTPVAIPLTPMLSPPIGTTADPVSAIRRRLSESVAIGDQISQYEFGDDETKILREKTATPTRISLSEPLTIPAIDELFDDYTTPPPIDQPPLVPQFRMRRSIKRCLEF